MRVSCPCPRLCAPPGPDRLGANSAHVCQSGLDFGCDFQANDLEMFEVVSFCSEADHSFGGHAGIDPGRINFINSGLVGSMDFHSSHPQGHHGRGAMRAEYAQGKPTQSHSSPSILVYEDNCWLRSRGDHAGFDPGRGGSNQRKCSLESVSRLAESVSRKRQVSE